MHTNSAGDSLKNKITNASVTMLAVGTLAFSSFAYGSNHMPLEEYLKIQTPTHIERVKALESRNNLERREVLKAMLEKDGIKYQLHQYKKGKHENIIFDVGQGTKMLIYTSHYDTYSGSPGANDAASCVASMTTAYKKLSEDPPKNLKVRFTVFGQHEKEQGLLIGSGRYVKDTKLPELLAVLSLESCGIGNPDGSAGIVFLWDMRKKDMKSDFAKSISATLEKNNITYSLTGPFRTKYSDHRAFRGKAFKGIPAFGMVVQPSEYSDRERWRSSISHSRKDTSANLHEANMVRTSDIVYLIAKDYDKRIR